MSKSAVEMRTATMLLVTLLLSSRLRLLDASASCAEVRRSFVARGVGSRRFVPFAPRRGRYLQVCATEELTCCTRKMERMYQRTASSDLTQQLHQRISSLQLDPSNVLGALTADVARVATTSRNRTGATLKERLGPGLDPAAVDAVTSRFFDAVKRAQEADYLHSATAFRTQLPHVQRFFEDIFILMLAEDTDVGRTEAECVRKHVSIIRPFGNLPEKLATLLDRATNHTLAFMQAVKAVGSVVAVGSWSNMTRECQQDLVRINFCSHCYGLTLISPCPRVCRKAAQGCLPGMAELGRSWVEFVDVTTTLARRIVDGGADLDAALLLVPEMTSRALSLPLYGSVDEMRSKCGLSGGGRGRGGGRGGGREKRSAQDANSTSSSTSTRRHRRRRQSRRHNSAADPRARVKPPYEMLRDGKSPPPPPQPRVITAKPAAPELVEIDEVTMRHRAVAARMDNHRLLLLDRIKWFVKRLEHSREFFRDVIDRLCDVTTRTSPFETSTSSSSQCWDGYRISKKTGRERQQAGNSQMTVDGGGDGAGMATMVEAVRAAARRVSSFTAVAGGATTTTQRRDDVTTSRPATAQLALCDDEDMCEGSGFASGAPHPPPESSDAPRNQTRARSSGRTAVARATEPAPRRDHRPAATVHPSPAGGAAAPRRRNACLATAGAVLLTLLLV